MLLIGTLMAVSLPAFSRMLAWQRVQQAVRLLQASVQAARAEAVRQGMPVTLRRKNDCAQRNWACGWTLFLDPNGNGLPDQGDTVLQDIGPLLALDIPTTGTNISNRIGVTAQGGLRNMAIGSFLVSGVGTDDPPCRKLVVSAGLRLREDNC